MDEQRRIFLAGAGQMAVLAACAPLAHAAGQAAPGAYPFSLGVASGSPLPNSVILWTRILADPLNAAAMPPVAYAVRWEVAHDEGFTRIAAKGSASAVPALAHSVHVDATGLDAASWPQPSLRPA